MMDPPVNIEELPSLIFPYPAVLLPPQHCKEARDVNGMRCSPIQVTSSMEMVHGLDSNFPLNTLSSDICRPVNRRRERITPSELHDHHATYHFQFPGCFCPLQVAGLGLNKETAIYMGPVQESVGRHLRYPGMPLSWYVEKNCCGIPDLSCLFKSHWQFFTDWTGWPSNITLLEVSFAIHRFRAFQSPTLTTTLS